jgi:hypothetical protein
MLALTNKVVGDIVIRADDNNYLYRLNALPASTLSNWEVLGKDAQPVGETVEDVITTNEIITSKANGLYAFTGTPNGGFPAGVTQGDIAQKSANIWTVVYTFINAPAAIFANSDGKTYFKTINAANINTWQVKSEPSVYEVGPDKQYTTLQSAVDAYQTDFTSNKLSVGVIFIYQTIINENVIIGGTADIQNLMIEGYGVQGSGNVQIAKLTIGAFAHRIKLKNLMFSNTTLNAPLNIESAGTCTENGVQNVGRGKHFFDNVTLSTANNISLNVTSCDNFLIFNNCDFGGAGKIVNIANKSGIPTSVTIDGCANGLLNIGNNRIVTKNNSLSIYRGTISTTGTIILDVDTATPIAYSILRAYTALGAPVPIVLGSMIINDDVGGTLQMLKCITAYTIAANLGTGTSIDLTKYQVQTDSSKQNIERRTKVFANQATNFTISQSDIDNFEAFEFNQTTTGIIITLSTPTGNIKKDIYFKNTGTATINLVNTNSPIATGKMSIASFNGTGWNIVAGGGGFSVIADTTTTTLNLNTVTATGITNLSALTSLTNGPTGIVPIVGKPVTVANYFATNATEQHLLLNDNKWFRSYINNIWSSWQLIATVDTTPNSNIIDGLATPPVSPSNGDAYVVLANPTGAWSTFAQGSIATYNESTVSWVNTIPVNGTAITFSNPVNLSGLNNYYIAGQTYKYNSIWGSPAIAGLLWQLFISSSQFQPYNNQSVSISVASNVATVTCPNNHNLAVGYSVIISSSPNAAFNETVIVTAIVNPTVFKYAKTLANTTTTGTLTATTQLLPSGCTSVLVPSTISFNVIIAVAAGSYSSSGSFVCTNLKSDSCYVAGIPIGKFESVVLIPNSTSQWQFANNTTYEILNLINHGFTNQAHRHKTIVKLETGNTYVLTDGADSSKVSYGKIILNVIDSNNILVGNGGKITTFADHGFVSGISYSYGNPTNGGIGNIVDGETLTTGNRATIPMLKVIDNRTIDFSPKVSFIAVNTVIVQAQIDSATKKYVLTDGQKTNDANASNNIITGSGTNTLTFNGATNTVYGKFSGIIETLLSTNIAKLASQIPVFNTNNPNLLLTTNINTVGAGNYILAINKAKTNGDGIFAIPLANFTDAVNNVATSITAGKIGYQLNPVVGYRHNGATLEQYDWIAKGQAYWDGVLFSNVVNYAFNRKAKIDWATFTAGNPQNFNVNIGTKSVKSFALYRKDAVTNGGNSLEISSGQADSAGNLYGANFGMLTNNIFRVVPAPGFVSPLSVATFPAGANNQSVGQYYFELEATY